jgi:hypothetical protein
MTRKDFADALRRHDWYYAYSDDHRYWTRGRDQAAALNTSHSALECPFDMATLRKWAHDMVVDHFAEEEPGNWYRQPRLYKCVAPTPRSDLITNEEHNNISRWMEE